MNNKNEKLRLTVKAALFAAMLCVLSPLTIPAGAVPFSLSLAAVYLCGAFQTPLYAVASTVCYLILGACGLPVFSNFSGGIGKLIGPTGGYLFSYPLPHRRAAAKRRRAGRGAVGQAVQKALGAEPVRRDDGGLPAVVHLRNAVLYGDRRCQPRRGACVLRGAVHLVRRTQDRFLHRPRYARRPPDGKEYIRTAVVPLANARGMCYNSCIEHSWMLRAVRRLSAFPRCRRGNAEHRAL